MRSLQRNWRTIHFAVPVGTSRMFDDYGNETLEVETLYSDPEKLNVNVSANAGQEVVNAFGSMTEYSRTVTVCGTHCPLVEGSRIWFGVDVTGSHNYTVVKVADSKNGFLIALREVSSYG